MTSSLHCPPSHTHALLFLSIPSATVMILQNQEIPADAILLCSSHPKGICFVETASLDGETSLKVKSSPAALQVAVRERATRKHGDDQSRGILNAAVGSNSDQLVSSASSLESRPAAANSSVAAPDVARVLSKLRGRIRCEAPNAQFDQFKGRLTIEGVDGFFSELASRDETSLDSSHLLLRGTVVKNTAFVFALVAYTGVESKIRKNCERAGAEPSSQSRLMLIMNRLICFQFVAQLVRFHITVSTLWHMEYSSFRSVHFGLRNDSLSRYSAPLPPSLRAPRHPS
jgi:magnesium-transporting ATPase (P-type)